MESIGSQFRARTTPALRCACRRARGAQGARGEGRGVQRRRRSTPASATWRSSPIPTATRWSCTATTRRGNHEHDADARPGREAVRRAAPADDEGRALALHVAARLCPGRTGPRDCPRDRSCRGDARPRGRRPRGRQRERDRDRQRAGGNHLRAAAGGLPVEADPRRRQVRAREPRALAARPARPRAEGRRGRQAALRQGDLERRLALLAHGDRRRGRRALHA